MNDVPAPLDPDTAARLERLRALARLMDTRLRLPLVPLRFGLDSVVGLVPVVGDTVSWAVAGWIVAEARKLGAPPELVGRMLANNAFDWAIGLVPVAGDLLDVGMRANTRNVRLLENALRAEAGGVSRSSDRATAPKRRSSPRA